VLDPRRKRLEQLASDWTPPLQLTPAIIDEAREWFEVLPAATGIQGSLLTGAATHQVDETPE
jgi:hypothetical protein